MNLTFGNMTVEVNIYNLLAQPNIDQDDITYANLVDALVQDLVNSTNLENSLDSSPLDDVVKDALTFLNYEKLVEEAMWCSQFKELPPKDSIPLPSSLEIPILELKQLP